MDPGNPGDNPQGQATQAPPPNSPPDTADTGRAPGVFSQATQAGPGPAQGGQPTVKALAIRGSAWAIGGNVTQQSLRFASNLLLARLLMPDAFGLMAIVSVVLVGLQLFSDIGIGPSIIQNRRGDEPTFYNTAWTLQVIRGFVLGLATIVLVVPLLLLVAGLLDNPQHGDAGPVYADPQLIPLICASALISIFGGFNSTKIFTVNRRLMIGRLTVIEVGAQALGILAMASWAWYYHSVWALVGGGLVTAWIKMLLSHTALPGDSNRFRFEREAFRELIHFGRWIFLSTSALFIAAQGDRLMLGVYLTKTMLGVYSIAYFLSEALTLLVETVARRVFLPAFSQVARENPDRLKSNYYRVRLRLDAMTLPAAGGLMVLGSHVVTLLYPDRYAEAGWMLQILAIRIAFACTRPLAVSCLLAVGDSKSVFAGNLAKTVTLLVGIPLGWHIGQLPGVVWVVALSELGSLPILWWRMSRHGLLSIPRELLAFVFVALGLGAGWGVRVVLSWL